MIIFLLSTKQLTSIKNSISNNLKLKSTFDPQAFLFFHSREYVAHFLHITRKHVG